MKTKSVPIEQIGLDLKKLSENELNDLAAFIEQCIKDELNKILGQRLLGYIATISIEVANDAINIGIDLEADSYLTSNISLGSVLDKVLHNVFTRTKVYLSTRFRESEKHSNI